MVRVGGWILVGLLVAWIAYDILFAGVGLRPPPRVIGFGSDAAGDLALPLEQINEAIDTARRRMTDVNGTGRLLVLGETIATWLSFATMAAVTLIAGYHGHAPSNGAPGGGQPGPLPTGAARRIAFLAALAAVLTGAGQLAGNQGRDAYDKADRVALLINQSRQQLVAAHTAAEEQAVLDNLLLKAAR